MERAQRLRGLWSWLPDFRAVAETEHLPSASAALHVSASSLSRTIRLLEDDVGRPLFDRVGRQIVLNDAGRVLLAAVRESMRGVDEALSTLGPGRYVGEVGIAAAGPVAGVFVLPALRALRGTHPELVPRMTSVGDGAVASALSMGRIDLALVEDPIPGEGLLVERLAEIPHAVCCGPGHPLHGRRRVTAEELADHDFVAPAPDASGAIPDEWPPSRPRHVGLYVHQMQLGIDAAASGAYLAVLPWPVAERAGLSRLPVRGIPGTELHAVRRVPLVEGDRAEVVLDAIRAVVQG